MAESGDGAGIAARESGSGEAAAREAAGVEAGRSGAAAVAGRKPHRNANADARAASRISSLNLILNFESDEYFV